MPSLHFLVPEIASKLFIANCASHMHLTTKNKTLPLHSPSRPSTSSFSIKVDHSPLCPTDSLPQLPNISVTVQDAFHHPHSRSLQRPRYRHANCKHPTNHPTSPRPTNTPQTASEGDGRGAAIWSEQKYAGQSVAIPGNEYCADLGMIMPNLEGKGRSIMVEADYRCQFYT
jgi:hypothetical protein